MGTGSLTQLWEQLGQDIDGDAAGGGGGGKRVAER